jgi:hypothetical protein
MANFGEMAISTIFHETGDNCLGVLVNHYWFDLQFSVAIGVTNALTSSSPQLIKLCFIQLLDSDCLAGGFG